MRPAEEIERLIGKLSDKTSARMDQQVRQDMLHALAESGKPSALTWPNLRRQIMKSPITKFAAAVVVIAAVIVSVTLWDKSVSSAYAVEQTIEAMRSIRSIHAYCTDWDDSRGEVWVQIDPETGREQYCRADVGNLVIVGTPQRTYYYHKDKNLVRIRDGYVPASEVRFSHLFADLVAWVRQYDGKLSLSSKYDEDFKRELIMLHVTVPAQADFGDMQFIVTVDIETKLPLTVRKLKGDPDRGVKSVDRIEYDLTIPERTFDFQIPQGAKVTYENADAKG